MLAALTGLVGVAFALRRRDARAAVLFVVPAAVTVAAWPLFLVWNQAAAPQDFTLRTPLRIHFFPD